MRAKLGPVVQPDRRLGVPDVEGQEHGSGSAKVRVPVRCRAMLPSSDLTRSSPAGATPSTMPRDGAETGRPVATSRASQRASSSSVRCPVARAARAQRRNEAHERIDSAASVGEPARGLQRRPAHVQPEPDRDPLGGSAAPSRLDRARPRAYARRRTDRSATSPRSGPSPGRRAPRPRRARSGSRARRARSRRSGARSARARHRHRRATSSADRGFPAPPSARRQARGSRVARRAPLRSRYRASR